MNEPLSESIYLAPAEPTFELSIDEILENMAEKVPHKEAFVFYPQNERISFVHLKSEAEKLAAGFSFLNLQKNDRLAIMGDNNSNFIITALAAMKLGIVFIGISPDSEPNDLLFILKQVDPKVIVCEKCCYAKLEIVYPDIKNLHSSQEENVQKICSLQFVIINGNEAKMGVYCTDKIKELSQISESKMSNTFLDDIGYLHTTSGSTGPQKIISCTYKQMINNAYIYGRRQRHAHEDHIICFPGPLWRGGIFITSVLVSLIFGIKTVYTPLKPHIDFNIILSIIEKERCTVIRGYPSFICSMIWHSAFSCQKVASLITVVTGGAELTKETIDLFIKYLKIKDIMFISLMGESNGMLLMSSPSECLSTSVPQRSIISNNEIKIVNDKGKIVPIDTIGEIYIRGFTVLQSYWRNDSLNQRYLQKDKWLKTDDYGVMQINGCVDIIGKKEEILIEKNKIKNLTALDFCLKNHNGIRQVKTIKVSNDENEDQICVCVVINDSITVNEEDLKELCHSKDFFPKHFLYLDSIPLTITDKVDISKLKEIALKLLLQDKKKKNSHSFYNKLQ